LPSHVILHRGLSHHLTLTGACCFRTTAAGSDASLVADRRTAFGFDAHESAHQPFEGCELIRRSESLHSPQSRLSGPSDGLALG